MNLVETYLQEMRQIWSSGAATPETSYYPALEHLINAVGAKLKPKVHCVLQTRTKGAGVPDGGLFTADQLQLLNPDGLDLLAVAKPARGAIEVKPLSGDAVTTARGEQVAKYCASHGQVLVTNYRDFVLVARDAEGKPAVLETFSLADNEKAFWAAAAHPVTTAKERGEALLDFLKRALLHAAPITSPEDVAWFLASYAREALRRLEAADVDDLASVRTALEEALGLQFEGEKGEHFFRSSLVQTLFYGIFSAWVLWHKDHPPVDAVFDWRTAAYHLRVPVIAKLFQEAAQPGQLRAHGLYEVLDWAGAALDRVDRAAFFTKFDEGQAVQYFYEPFLRAFDPELRKQLGVWYTPPEVVQYMVARVDRVLRDELDIPDGLADARVYVLDPCCGTGAFLVEALRVIGETLRAKGDDALVAHEVKQAASARVFGFEILPAPFVVAHLQVGLMLQNLGAPLGAADRAGVYLTNALTGWEPPQGPKQHLLFHEFEEERDAADEVKRAKPILVVLGNPPYNGFAGVAMGEERELSQAYRKTKRAPAPQGQGLNDLYVRFFRLAEHRIVEQTGKGVVCFISNYSWLDSLSFTGMRERYLEVFNDIWIDCLNGDKYKTGKLTPSGEPDPSVMSTEFNPVGIQVGTAIALLVRQEAGGGVDAVRFRHLWGKTKRAQLVESAENDGRALYEDVQPELALGLAFAPAQVADHYLQWPALPDLFPVSFPGVKTSRDAFVVDIDWGSLGARVRTYLDPNVSDAEIERRYPQVMAEGPKFDPLEVRERLAGNEFRLSDMVRYLYRPFDYRWLYWEPETNLLDRKRPDYFGQVFEGNVWFSAGQHNRMEDFYQPQFTSALADHHIVESNASVFPLLSRTPAAYLFDDEDIVAPNLTREALRYLDGLGAAPKSLFFHALAVLHAPEYCAENAAALRQDWPRLPLPTTAKAMALSSMCGEFVSRLLDTETPALVMSIGRIEPLTAIVGTVSREGGGSLDPEIGDLSVTAGWGHPGRGGITMPGQGKAVARDYTPGERAAIEEAARGCGLSPEQAFSLLGGHTFDIYLNDVAYWKNVPAGVWDYRMGGYQVVKKWLSYREEQVLRRRLMLDEARYVTEMVKRLVAIRFYEPVLDRNYELLRASTYPWPGGK